MSTDPSAEVAFLDRHHFLIRRLHSLSGIVPVGAFLVVHLSANASALLGPEVFQKNVESINSIPLLPLVELLFIFLPIVFHAAFGVVIWLTSANNVGAYRYGGNIRYMLQRTTGIIALVFIVFHVFTMHRWGLEWFHVFDPATGEPAAFKTAAAGVSRWWFVPAVYAVGTLCAVYHLANGIWTTLITWGITVGPKAQRTVGYVCAVFGIVLGLMGLGALSGLRGLTGGNATPTEAAAHTTVVTEQH